MDLIFHFRMLAKYNRIANEHLYEACGKLEDGEYRKMRAGSFGSIHALLNHILLGDRIWMARFRGEGKVTPPLNSELYSGFGDLSAARRAEDKQIIAFFDGLGAAFLEREISYTNSLGMAYVEKPAVAVTHMFNHQTHHRGQIHVMLSQTSVAPPSLDMHRIINP